MRVHLLRIALMPTAFPLPWPPPSLARRNAPCPTLLTFPRRLHVLVLRVMHHVVAARAARAQHASFIVVSPSAGETPALQASMPSYCCRCFLLPFSFCSLGFSGACNTGAVSGAVRLHFKQISISTQKSHHTVSALTSSPPLRKAAMGSNERWLCMRYASISSSAQYVTNPTKTAWRQRRGAAGAQRHLSLLWPPHPSC